MPWYVQSGTYTPYDYDWLLHFQNCFLNYALSEKDKNIVNYVI